MVIDHSMYLCIATAEQNLSHPDITENIYQSNTAEIGMAIKGNYNR